MVFDVKGSIRSRRLLAKMCFAGSVFLCSTGTAVAALTISKTIDGTTTIPAAENDVVRYNLTVTNTGPGALTNVVIDDVPSNLNNLIYNVTSGGAPPNFAGPGINEYTFNTLAAGQTVTLDLDATVNAVDACPVVDNTASVSENAGTFTDSSIAPSIEYDFEFTSGTTSNVISHVTATSFCEFCDTGEVHITITNPTTAPMTNIVLVEDLQSLGLTFVNGSTTSSIGGAANPTITGGGTLLTWTSGEIGALASLAAGATVEITFDVSTYTEVSILADTSRDLFATATFDMTCLAASQTVNSGQFELPIRQPEPDIFKVGRNFDAGQTAAAGYSDPVFGSRNDDVIWRVNVQNSGLANMQALRINDAITGNFSINFVCPTEGMANALANNNGALPGGSTCDAFSALFDADDPFGNATDPDDVTAGSTNANIFYVGRILNTHANETNNADISWGCEATSPGSGTITVPASTGGFTPGVTLAANAGLNTTVTPANVLITQTVTGSNTAQPLGTKGLMTITINNQSGGSIQNLVVSATLPTGYVMDNTYGVVNGVGNGQPTFTTTPAFGGTYPGFIDTFTRDDPELITANPLDDTDPTFTLTSSTTGADPTQQVDMLRHDDQLSFTFGIIMVNAARFDIVEDLDLAPEVIGDGTDPTNALALTNDVDLDFDSVDSSGAQNQTRSETFNYNSNPEDLDIDISDSLFILTNNILVPLDLNVLLTNNGGHDANDHTTYITFGQAMTVQTVPAGCAVTTNPPPHPVWNDPSFIPVTAAVYACDRGTHAPGATETITFSVVKNTAGGTDDDLTFRADVVGEIAYVDGTLLTDPAPATVADTTPNLQLANNYSLDGIRSRVLGFNLTKSVWHCFESGVAEPAPSVPPPATPADLNIQIGEDCNYFIESGGWFGFVTPGFSLIEVQDVVVTDDLPDGQGFIAFDAVNSYNFTNTANINLVGANGGAGTTPLDETDITFSFNAAGSGIVVKDEFFRVDMTTRLLNDQIDSSAAPNSHSDTSTDIARTSFTAIFQSAPIGGVVQPQLPIPVSDALSIPGYPTESVRRVDMTVIEPDITVVKTVCNETLNVVGTGCGAFSTAINNGDTDDAYIYRIVLTNGASNSGVARAPAFNVISTDTLDSSDLMFIEDFAADGLDNDGDGAIDEADETALYAAISDNVINNATPAVITVDDSFSAPLLQVDPGDSVTFYYRVNPDDAIAPLQTLTNTVSMTYDSLDTDFGSQNTPQLDNTATAPNDAGRARIYTTVDATADVQMIPLVAQPKAIIAVSNSTLGGAPQEVVIGEEVRYELTTQLPVANLRSFVIRDSLPTGMRCVENGPDVDLGAGGPHAAAGFNPGGIITPVCSASGDEMVWDFGDQELTMAGGASRFDFVIDFVARVDNAAANQDGLTLTNGGGAGAGGTDVTATYVNEATTTVTLDFAAVDVMVTEPDIALTKTFAVANSDAADILTVTITATNNGTAAAYNLQLLDDLTGSDLTYINDSMAGADAPDDDGVAANSKLPTFSWLPANADYEITPTTVKTFTFQVSVDTTAQPLEILDNTIEGKWDSLPGLTTALNAGGTIGPDGSVTGLRNGVLPNAAGALNDYETTATASTTVLPLTLNKNDLNVALIPTIGAHKNFEVVITLPEGTSNNLVVTDDLIFSGLSYALSRNATFDVSYTFTNIVSINGAAPAEAVFTGQGLGTLPVDADTGTIEWNIGTVITAEENDTAVNAVNPSITINYFARVNNDLVTDDTDTLQNSATVTYDNGETAATETLNDTTAVQTVVEPLLVFNPVIVISNLTSPGVLPDSGDILEYEVTIENTGTSEAFDVNVVSTLPTQLLFDTALPVPTALIGGVAVGGFTSLPAASPAGPLVWGRGNADNTLDIPVGESLVLTYRAVVQNLTEPNIVMDTDVSVDWTSLDDADVSAAFERTGAGCPVTVAPNDYCIDVTASTTAIDDNSIVKTIILDTYDTGLSTAVDSTVRVGDTVTYRLQMIMQEGTTSTVTVVDTLPTGMTFVGIDSINGDTTADYDSPSAGSGSNFTYATLTAANVPTAGDTGAIIWTFGDIVNDAAGDATTDTIVIEYRARVTEDAGLVQQPTTTITNSTDLNYIDGNLIASNPVTDPRLRDTSDLTLLQPVMDALTKVDRDGTPVSGDTINVATDTMNFRLETCNTTGLAPSYGLLITDNLPTQLDETSLTGPNNGALTPDVFIGGVLATEGAANDYVYTPPAVRGGDMVFFFNTEIDPGDCVDIEFDIDFYTDFAANQSWSNTVTVDEYYSLPPTNAQQYVAIGPVLFNMNNNIGAFPPPDKVMTQPLPAVPVATVGDEIIYEITVPATPVGAVMFDVTISDILDNSLVYLSATDIGANAYVLTDNTVLPGTVELIIPQILAGQQAVIELRVRVDNNASANAGVAFSNAASYTFANTVGGVPINGGTDNTTSTLTIVEPAVAVAKAVANVTNPGVAPDAGDILRYTITLTASGGAANDLFSDAFDVSLADTLSLGLLYNANLSVDGAGNTINAPVTAGDGVTVPQTLGWNLASANADIDVVEGTVVTVNYDVLVLDTVLANQNLTNSVDIQWQSRDGPDANQRDGSGLPLNDYFSVAPATTLLVTPDNNAVVKSRLTDTFGGGDNIVRIGDIVEYELRINLQEGTHTNFTVEDNLPQGMIYEETVSINGVASPYIQAVPFTHTTITDPVVAGDPTIGPTTVTWSASDLVNQGDNLANNDFVIVYHARVLNLVHAQANNLTLTNNVNVDYTTAIGAAPTETSTIDLDLQQPDLSITKVANPAGGDSVIDASELVTYVVQITNNGTAPAYDVELLDTIPLGLRSPTITVIDIRLLVSGDVIDFNPVYNQATGAATWDFDSGTADQYTIPAGDTMQVIYQVQADAGLGAGLTLTNRAQVQFYYSFDDDAVPVAGIATGVREIYVPVTFAEAVLTTALPNALLKENPVDLIASIGETFTYRITVPDVTQPTALYDVRILDDLNASTDLLFISATKVSGSEPWTPADTGTVANNVIIADAAIGIDVPANEQIEIDITVALRDTAANFDTVTFNNTASYTFNQIDNNNTTQSNGLGNTTANMLVVEPDLTLDKRGPVGTVNFATLIPYTVVVENIGTGPAFDTTIIDQLPEVPDNPPLTGGTCDTAPINFDVRITTTADELTVVRALALGADYTATHTAAPTCELVVTTLTDAARIESGEKLIVSYDVMLDAASQAGALLTNIAGVTQYFSLDTAGAGATGEIREYTNIITNGTTGTIDHEDAFTVTVDAPVLDVMKTVVNITTGQDPGSNATPGDTLRYTIIVSNAGIIDAAGVTVSDAIPVNATYIADSVTLNGIAVGQPDGGVSPLTAGIDISSADLTPPLPTAGNGVISVGQVATITFDVLLNAAITSGTVITNQALVNSPSTGILASDDPNISGNDDPLVIGDEDPTETLIASTPAFLVQKTSQDRTGDATVLVAGDTLRYTITVKNIGLEDSINNLLSDQIPVNTVYVANSTTLNGAAVADASVGVSALQAGMLINAPENTTAGFLRADTSAAANNVATITFDVVINLTVVDGTVISNQGFLSGDGAGSGIYPQQPTDDPATAAVDDPTLDTVGNVPVVDVLKTVTIQIDNGTIGVVDPGDTLRYTITTSNIGAIPATGVVLVDATPANTTYVLNSVTLDGIAVPDVVGVSPLIAGVDISSSDLTPPLPTAGNGTLTAGRSAVVTFDVQVGGAVAAGTIISNQGNVSSNEVPDELSDADGNDANGDQPTDVVVGNVQQLAITKQVLVVGGGAALAGGQLEYVVRVTNIGGIAASNVIITDDLDFPVATQMTLVAGSARLDGLAAGVSLVGSTVTADYATTYGDLPSASITELRFRVLLNSGLTTGTTVSNRGDVSWNLPTDTISTPLVDIDIGGVPGATSLNGNVWHDSNFDNVIDTGELLLQDYRVRIYRSNILLGTTQTDSDGQFQFSGLTPNLPTGDPYELRYSSPGAVGSTASLGQTNSAFTDGAQRITGITAASGTVLQNLNLPRQPNGVVYDSVLRVPVPGARLTMINQSRSNQQVPTNCFADTAQQNQVTLTDGYYKFELEFGDPGCLQNHEYVIQIQPPSDGYVGTTSAIIPPVASITAAAFNVPNCPGNNTLDKITGTAQHCENSASEFQAPDTVEPRTSGTNYNLKLLLNDSAPLVTNQIFNNHIPVDPELEAAVTISKVAGLQNVTRSQLVPYTITIKNTLPVQISDLNIVDNFPAGFKYVVKSARIDGDEVEPVVNGRVMVWQSLDLEVNETRVIRMLLVVGSGVGEGEYVNTVQVINARTNEAFSGVASATVQVIPDPTFDCTDIIGKVYDDKNLNAYQDDGEKGLPGVQVATARGLRITTDAHGRFHITCAVVPNEIRGSNFIMKLDERSLPSGFRMTSENPRVQRATRGKMMKFNFGASIHRVVRLDLADGVFEKGSVEIRPQWMSRIDYLITELEKDASILRLSYLGENETESEVDDRLDAVEEIISDRWEELNCCYKLTIEKEVFWRKGNPSDRKAFE